MKLLAIIPERKIQEVLIRMSKALVKELLFFNDFISLEKAARTFKSDDSYIVFVDIAFYDRWLDIIEVMSDRNLDCRFISLGSNDKSHVLPVIENKDFGRCYIAKDSIYFEEQLFNQLSLLCATSPKDSMFIDLRVPWQEYLIKDTFGVNDAIEMMFDYTTLLKLSMKTALRLKMVSFEMISNSLFNLPRFMDKPVQNIRKKNISLNEKEFINFYYRYDGRKFSVVCEDFNGTLTFDNIFTNLKRAIENRSIRTLDLRDKRGGIGFYMMWHIFDELWISVQKNKRTICMGSLYPPEISRTRRKISSVQCFSFIDFSDD